MIALPRLSKDLNSSTNLKELIEQDETVFSVSIYSESIASVTAKGFSAQELRLKQIDATKAKLEKTNLSDVEVLGCELTATAFSDSSWRRIVVKDSRCTGVQLQMSTLRDATFSNCNLNLANFRYAKLINVCFEDCTLEEADFYSAEMRNVTFQKCTMDKAEFSASKLTSVDFRSSEIASLKGVSYLAGAIIDSLQLVSLAPVLANELQIEVRDE